MRDAERCINTAFANAITVAFTRALSDRIESRGIPKALEI